MPHEIRTVAIVGCGVIGMGWATLFLSQGLKVIVSDPAKGAKEALERYLDQARPFFEGHGDFEQLASNYEFVSDIATRLVEADFVQEVNLVLYRSIPRRTGAADFALTCRMDQNVKSSRESL